MDDKDLEDLKVDLKDLDGFEELEDVISGIEGEAEGKTAEHPGAINSDPYDLSKTTSTHPALDEQALKQYIKMHLMKLIGRY